MGSAKHTKSAKGGTDPKPAKSTKSSKHADEEQSDSSSDNESTKTAEIERTKPKSAADKESTLKARKELIAAGAS
ncbi:hypothetical protein VPNG_09622 [Cytospora leucostoma]|uniref:Uncharacterized protein n=1 Tax=Cytospora leucostoma TaxID=1230097 RepID=A0A423VQX7_9PEZI|nr:hypothetical protein VPNG_09622 [Cytospora leucostoma]